jgi:3-(3-hydroxy-phenyl)propionate hydroxylase
MKTGEFPTVREISDIPTECDVAVVGAGPTGLTLANLLGQAGVRVVLIERNRTTVEAPRAVSIDDESLRTMQAIDLADAVIKDVALDYGSHYFSPSGTCFLKVEPKAREYGFPRRNAFAQPKLEATLRAGLARFANVTSLFGCACDGVTEDDGGVTLTLTPDGAASRTLRACYVAGCDGARSALRKHIGATLTGSTYRQRWLIVDLKDTRERLRQTRVSCDPDRPFITPPGPGGTRRYEFMLHDDEDDDAVVEPQFVRRLLADAGPDADAEIARRQVYVFHARIADRWNSARIFLAGDAAHLTPPFAGQGMNSGIRDAHNLGWKLAEVVAGGLGPGLLATYQKERAPHAWALIELAINMGRVMMPTSHLQAFAVRMGFRAVGLIPGLQDYFSQMKYKPKPFFRDGFLLPDDGGLGVAGRLLRQPVVELVDRTRTQLDEILGPRFSLLAYGADAQAIAGAARQLDFGLPDVRAVAILPAIYNADPGSHDAGVTVGRDLTGEFGAALPPETSTLMVVRPDRYVAAATPFDAASLGGFAAAVKTLVAETYAGAAAAVAPAATVR